MSEFTIHSLPILKVFDQNGYPAVGRCIYCLGTTGLTKEHIVGRGIGGTITLFASTCEKCQEITRDIEQFCFNKMMREFRVKEGFPTSLPKASPARVRARVGEAEATVLELARHELPGVIVVPKIPPPKILFGPWHPVGPIGLGQTHYTHFMHNGPGTLSAPQTIPTMNKEALPNFTDMWTFISDMKWATNTVFTVACNFEIYARMLAKVAHAYACAEIGLGNFRPFLREVILNADNDPFQYIGCLGQVGPDNLPPEPYLHWLSFQCWEGNGKLYLIVRMRLLAFIGAPGYHVVVGEVDEMLEAAMTRLFRSRIRAAPSRN